MALAAGARIAPGMGFVRRSPHHFAMRTSPATSREAAPTVSKPWLAAAVGVLVLLRIPSFLEPHWYSDESTYSYVGRTIVRGGDLYTSTGAWDNKPPLQYWTYGILTHFLGYSEAAIHLVPFLGALAAVAAIGWGVARLTGSPGRAGIACVLAVLTLGSPLFDAQLFLPEGALIGPMTWAGMMLLVFITSPEWAARHRWVPYVAGALASIALGLQQTVIADVVTLSIILVIATPGRWRHLLPLWGTGLAVSAFWFLPTVIASGWSASLYATVGYYTTYAHKGLPSTVTEQVLHFAGIAGGLVALLVGAAILGRRVRYPSWMLWLLGGIDLLVAGSTHFTYPHLLIPAIPWLAAAIAATPWHRASLLGDGSRLALRSGIAVMTVGIILAYAEGSYAGSYWINSGNRSLSTYYIDGYDSLLNSVERASWQASFSSNVVPDIKVAAWLDSHHYAGSSAVLWSVGDEWLYLTTPLFTTLPTVGLFNDDVLLGGSGADIGPYVARHRPRIVITDMQSVVQRPTILPVLARYYVEIFADGPYIVYVQPSAMTRGVTTTTRSPGARETRSDV